MNYTYILECKDGTYYTGWTNNLDKRVKDHNAGKGAKYTKARLPVSLIYYEVFQTKQEFYKFLFDEATIIWTVKKDVNGAT